MNTRLLPALIIMFLITKGLMSIIVDIMEQKYLELLIFTFCENMIVLCLCYFRYMKIETKEDE